MKSKLRHFCLLIGLAATLLCLPARGQQELEWDKLADRPFPEWFRELDSSACEKGWNRRATSSSLMPMPESSTTKRKRTS